MGGRHAWALMLLTSVLAAVLLTVFLVYALDESFSEVIAFVGPFTLAMVAVQSGVLLWRARRSS